MYWYIVSNEIALLFLESMLNLKQSQQERLELNSTMGQVGKTSSRFRIDLIE